MTKQQKEWLKRNPAYSLVQPDDRKRKWLRQGYLLTSGKPVDVQPEPREKASALIVGVPVYA